MTVVQMTIDRCPDNDAIFPSTSRYGFPDLRPDMLCEAIPDEVIARSVGAAELGPYGLCFTVRARYTYGGYNVVYDSIVSIPSGVYPSHEDVASAVQWFSWNLGTCKILVLPCDDGRYMMRLNNSVGDDATFSIMLYVPYDTTASTTEPRLLTCNPLRALGFTSWQYDSQTLANASSWDVTAEAYPCTAYRSRCRCRASLTPRWTT